MTVESALPDVVVTTKPKEREETSTRRIPPYNVIIENDDYHTFDFVIDVLCKVFGLAAERAAQFALHAHNTGRAIVWTVTQQVADLKVEQIRTFQEVREHDGAKLGPLGCTIEPAPGG